MPPVTVLIKPASGNCNMRCKYCFYCDEMTKRAEANRGMMQRETLEMLVKKVLSYADGSCSFGFQGGEPTLAGLAFFQDVIQFQKQYNVHAVKIYNAIQTNGLRIDQAWADFLREHRFLVGVSLDGPSGLHDWNRLGQDGCGTHARVMEAIRLLERSGVPLNILTVVTAQAARRTKEIYSFFMRNRLWYQQYIPCLNPLGDCRGQQPYALTPERYASFLQTLFDCWYQDRLSGKAVYIRNFENLAGMLLGHQPEHCGMRGVCSPQYAVEADGSVYPCDFYMLDAYLLGNVHTDSFEEMKRRCLASGFVRRSMNLPAQCLQCGVRFLCRGGCFRERVPTGEAEAPALNYFCNAYRAFYWYAAPKLGSLLGLTH